MIRYLLELLLLFTMCFVIHLTCAAQAMLQVELLALYLW
jgi:hypothetical protein